MQNAKEFIISFLKLAHIIFIILILQMQISLTTGNLYLACLVIKQLYNATMLQRISKRVLVDSGS